MIHDNKVRELKKMLGQDRQNNDTPHPASLGDTSSTQAETPDNPSGDSTDEATLKTEIESLRESLNAQKNDYLRTLAEFDNFKKRLEKEKIELMKYANQKVIEDVFPVLDGLENTLAHVNEDQKQNPVVAGVELILKQLLQILNKHGLEEVPATGQDFDPNLHEAIATEEAQGVPPGKVITTHRKGYRLKDKLIRATLVTVSK